MALSLTFEILVLQFCLPNFKRIFKNKQKLGKQIHYFKTFSMLHIL